MKRRTFLQTAGAAVAASTGFQTGARGQSSRAGASTARPAAPSVAPGSVVLVLDPADPVASAPPVRWVATDFLSRLQVRKIAGRLGASLTDVLPGEICIVLSGPTLVAPAVMPPASRPPATAESFTLSNANINGRRMIVAAGRDPRGVVYAILELADRLEYEATPAAAFQITRIVEQPANRIRSVLRAFVSEVEDKPWFYDRTGWHDYLTMLATHRFNRLNLTFGIGYDFVSEIRDSYFHFAYPFFVNVPGYNVQINIASAFGAKPTQFSDAERTRNLAVLQFISSAAAERGIDFQLGLWTHAWNFDEAPNATHRITGLTAATHATYCRDALHALLVACPGITGVTMRTHGESGVPEQSYPFWKTVFSGIVAAGRKIEIDQHAKGIDAEMIGLAQSTGMPTTVSPKYWAEHMGLPYHQAAIRPNEMPSAAEATKTGALMSLSSGSRNFMRYGYGDLMREDRKHSVLHRIWPGTQRLLLWGDPKMAAAYGRASSFAGSDGVEWMEPLSFKGRRGSGSAGGRTAYAGIVPATSGDWQKFRYTYRVWGRGIYNPEGTTDARKRFLKAALGPAADACEEALALSSRILPTITTAHMPSAACANYWPEIYTNQSLLEGGKDPYSDTPAPKRFGTVSPLDSQLFGTVDQCAADILAGTHKANYTPLEVAAWLEQLARDSESKLAEARAAIEAVSGSPVAFEHKQWATDIAIQNNIGKFFAAKFRAGVLYGIYVQTADPAALEEAVKAYRGARDAWQAIADIANTTYRPDLTFGYNPQLRGTWRDRLAAIDQDIVALEAARSSATQTSATAMIVTALSNPHREIVALQHTPAKRFRAGAGVVIEASLPANVKGKVRLLYRHVNQAEKWVGVGMDAVATGFRAEIPAGYVASVYPLQYYFEVELEAGGVALYPGLPRDYSAQPYFVMRRG